MATSESNGQSNSFEPPIYTFPPYLEKPISPANIFSHIRKKGVVDYNDIADICSKYCTKLDKAKKRLDNITQSYARTILNNLINDLRGEKRLEWLEENGEQVDGYQVVLDPIQSKTEQEEKEKRHRLVEEAIQELGLELREQVVIRLKVYRPEKFTYREIAKIVGFSPSTVRVKYDEYWNRINNYVEQGMSENA